MKTQKITRKRKARMLNYLAGALLGMTSLFGCGKEEPRAIELPVKTETRKQLSQTYQSLENAANEARNLFNESIKDGYFSLKEQKDVYKIYATVEKEYDTRNSELPLEHKNLYSLINQNLYRTDFGITDLEENLRAQNLSVAVENQFTLPEGFIVTTTGLGLGLTSILLLLGFLDSRKK